MDNKAVKTTETISEGAALIGGAVFGAIKAVQFIVRVVSSSKNKGD